MTDEETSVDPKAHATPDTYGETLLYDYAKHLTGLSLLALGGVLSITQAADSAEIKPTVVGIVVVFTAIAGILAFSTASSLVDARAAGRPPRSFLPKLMKLATGFLGMGMGAFLSMWLDTLR